MDRLPNLRSGLLVWVLAAFIAGGWWAREAAAHPVAQGSFTVIIYEHRVRILANVSLEQVHIGERLGAGSPEAAAGDSLSEIFRRHGAYLARHISIIADGRPLAGRVAEVREPKNVTLTASEVADHDRRRTVTYDLEYAPPAGAPGGPIDRVEIRQDVLNEFDYAPGNAWEATYLVWIRRDGEEGIDGLLLTRREPLIYPPSGTAGLGRTFHDFTIHGIHHILSGWDHLLFICALVLAAASIWDFFKVVTAFTVAHTLTLALSALDLVRLSSTIVEPMIAASIVIVSLQNLISPRTSRGWSRLAVAFFFGLFHGLGFAGGLRDVMGGLSAGFFITALVAFSIGVEIGHQLIALPLYTGVRLATRLRRDLPARARLRLAALRYGSALISCAGIYYLVNALRSIPGSS